MHDREFIVHKEENIILINAARYRRCGAAMKRMRRCELAAEFSFEVASLLAIRHWSPRLTPLNFHV